MKFQTCPTEQRVVSIFYALTAIPLSFLYRERQMITNWRDTHCWLPSTTEGISINSGSSIMWRRSQRDDFFIFELSSGSRQDQVPRSQLPTFHFLRTSIGCLTLVNREKNQGIWITPGIAEYLFIPHLDVCIFNREQRCQWQHSWLETGRCRWRVSRRSRLTKMFLSDYIIYTQSNVIHPLWILS